MYFGDRPSPLEKFDAVTQRAVDRELFLTLRYFAGAGLEHMQRFGTSLELVGDVRRGTRCCATPTLLDDPVYGLGAATTLCGAAERGIDAAHARTFPLACDSGPNLGVAEDIA